MSRGKHRRKARNLFKVKLGWRLRQHVVFTHPDGTVVHIKPILSSQCKRELLR